MSHFEYIYLASCYFDAKNTILTASMDGGAGPESTGDVVRLQNAAATADEKLHLLTGGLFLASITGVAVLFGFGTTLAMAKKRDPNFFGKGLMPSRELGPEGGGALAMRALGRGTLYSVSGFGLFCLVVWKAMGVHNLQEFRDKMRSMMPQIPKSQSPGRSDFKSIRELMQYISEDKNKPTK